MTKTRKRPVDREGPIHRSILNYLRTQFPQALLHHSPNETKWRSEKARMVVQKALANGTVKGFPDLMMWHAGRFYAFEVKAPGNYPTDDQKDVGSQISANGGFWAVVRSIDDTMVALQRWGVLG